MKFLSDIVHQASFRVIALLGVVAGMVLAEAAPAKAQAMQLLYIYSGVTDNGAAANVGVATSFHCSNFSGADQSVQVVVFANTGTLLANVTRVISNSGTGGTQTFSTHQTVVFT